MYCSHDSCNTRNTRGGVQLLHVRWNDFHIIRVVRALFSNRRYRYNLRFSHTIPYVPALVYVHACMTIKSVHVFVTQIAKSATTRGDWLYFKLVSLAKNRTRNVIASTSSTYVSWCFLLWICYLVLYIVDTFCVGYTYQNELGPSHHVVCCIYFLPRAFYSINRFRRRFSRFSLKSKRCSWLNNINQPHPAVYTYVVRCHAAEKPANLALSLDL